MLKPSALVLWLSIIVAGACIDQVTKYLIVQNFSLGESMPLIPSLNLWLNHNVGIAFGWLGGLGPWALVAATFCVTLALFIWLVRTPSTWLLQHLALSFIIAGAVGNLIDRAMRGYVVDFIDFYIKSWHFHTFNIADAFITIGAGLLIISSFIYKQDKPL